MKSIKYLLSVLIFIALVSCTKDDELPTPKTSYSLSFMMKGKAYEYNSFYLVSHYLSCGLNQYEIQVLNKKGDLFDFFKINLTDVDSLVPGKSYKYRPGYPEAYKFAGTSSFWYSGSGAWYTPVNFTITVLSYSQGRLTARFEGDSVSGDIRDVYLPFDPGTTVKKR